ncbi:MAG: hypothetical protein H0W64_08910 [Gammaproteobacteria bacterium]|nr:hypothetical protein [Gammaproteobacteria bacterium]
MFNHVTLYDQIVRPEKALQLIEKSLLDFAPSATRHEREFILKMQSSLNEYIIPNNLVTIISTYLDLLSGNQIELRISDEVHQTIDHFRTRLAGRPPKANVLINKEQLLWIQNSLLYLPKLDLVDDNQDIMTLNHFKHELIESISKISKQKIIDLEKLIHVYQEENSDGESWDDVLLRKSDKKERVQKTQPFTNESPLVTSLVQTISFHHHQFGLRELEDKLKLYLAQKSREAKGDQKYCRYKFFGINFGFTFGEKQSAVNKFQKMLQNGSKVNLTSSELQALRNGELGDIIKKYEKLNLLPVEFLRQEQRAFGVSFRF